MANSTSIAARSPQLPPRLLFDGRIGLIAAIRSSDGGRGANGGSLCRLAAWLGLRVFAVLVDQCSGAGLEWRALFGVHHRDVVRVALDCGDHVGCAAPRFARGTILLDLKQHGAEFLERVAAHRARSEEHT